MKDTYVSSLRDLLDPQSRETLSSYGTPTHFAPGETLFSEGEPGSSLFMIESGQVEISTITLAGRKVVLAHLGRNDIVGEVAVLDEGPRSATATAVSDVTGRIVGLRDFRRFLLETPDVHLALTVELCAKLRAANERLEDRTEKTGDGRLARAVLRLAQKFGKPNGAKVVIPFTLSQSELGELSGLTRANVNRYLRSWAADDLVAFHKQTLTLLDTDRLRELADS